MFLNNKADEWLDAAVSEIVFGPDREKVRRELRDHLEDRAADLRRVFPDIPEEEAQDRALSGMGDAEELKFSLAKVHKPWMGWLWKISQAALVLVLIGVFVFGSWLSGDWNELWGQTAVVRGTVKDGERAELGGYTFQIKAAAFLDAPEDSLSRSDCIQVVLRASSPRFWERLSPEALDRWLTLTREDGRTWAVSPPLDSPEDKAELGVFQPKWGFFYRDYFIYLDTSDWTPGEVVMLRLDAPAGEAELSVPVTERVEVKG